MIYLTAVISGISTGCLYALVALGYNLVYNATSVFNFAQGDLVSFGGLLTYWLFTTHNWPVLGMLVPVVVCVAVAALLQERISIAPIIRGGGGEGRMGWVITTLGASVVLENVFQLIWGSTSRQVASLARGGPIVIWHSPLTLTNLIIILVALGCAIALDLWGRLTLTGKAWRATSEDRAAALVRGIDVRRVGMVAFIVAGAVSGLAGAVTVPSTGAAWNSGATLAQLGFVAIAIGGFGSQFGAIVGGVVLGLFQQVLLIWVTPTLFNALAFAALLISLMLRPTGLIGQRQEREV